MRSEGLKTSGGALKDTAELDPIVTLFILISPDSPLPKSVYLVSSDVRMNL